MAALSSAPEGWAAVPFSRPLRGGRTRVSCRDFSLKMFNHPRQIGGGASLVLRPKIGAGVLDRTPLPYAAINCLQHPPDVLSLPPNSRLSVGVLSAEPLPL